MVAKNIFSFFCFGYKPEQFRFLDGVSLAPTWKVTKSNPGDILAGAKSPRRPYLGKYGSRKKLLKPKAIFTEIWSSRPFGSGLNVPRVGLSDLQVGSGDPASWSQ